MSERLAFDGRMPYNSMLAAEHVSRYLLAANLCRGKRVLDIACGEGYGSRLLKDAGAAYVLGVDLSEQAIASAVSLFGAPDLTFKAGDALDELLFEGEAPFDVIISFETIEHVADPQALLNMFARLRTEDGMIVISCPNDEIENVQGVSNPYHFSVFSFAEFKDVAETALGPAAGWLVGTPITGISVRPIDDAVMSNQSSELALLMQPKSIHNSYELPAQPDHAVSPGNAAFFIGVWGGSVGQIHVQAPMSRTQFLAAYFEIRRLIGLGSQREKQIDFLEAQTYQIRRSAQLDHTRLKRGMQLDAEQKNVETVRLQTRLSGSRAHRFAEKYIAVASSRGARILLVPLRRFVAAILRVIR